MNPRPFKNEKIDFFEECLQANYFSLSTLHQLHNELLHRNTYTYPRYGSLKGRVDARIAQLSEIHVLLAKELEYAPFKEWFYAHDRSHAVFQGAVSTGSSPVEESQFDNFLLRSGIVPYYIGADLDILIVGREGWNAEELMIQLDIRIERQLKVYSQEMVLSFIGCGKDPFEYPDLLPFFGSGHPALEFLAGIGFPWPSTIAPIGTGSLPEVDWPKQGLLSYMGYQVGVNAARAEKRRQILAQVFDAKDLPKVDSPEYMRQWGGCRSSQRLYKMSHSIASFARNAIRNDPDRLAIAIRHWTDDLDWLKRTYYTGRFQFEWPSILVGHEFHKRSS